jgi:hypothetical protein
MGIAYKGERLLELETFLIMKSRVQKEPMDTAPVIGSYNFPVQLPLAL